MNPGVVQGLAGILCLVEGLIPIHETVDEPEDLLDVAIRLEEDMDILRSDIEFQSLEVTDVAGGEDDMGMPWHPLHPLKKFKTIHVGHDDVADQEVGPFLFEVFQGRLR